MSKRLRATIVCEYDADPRDYGTEDATEMCRIDMEGMGGDFSILAETLAHTDFTLKIEEVPNE